MSARRLVIAGTHSGVGKTTVALGLMAALVRRGLVVQPFKVGPDFIDPGHHTAVCGRVSRNLDTWMLSEETVRATFARAAQDADISIVEGVMGLFDGRSADDPRGSTAHLAKLLDAPVLLVVDASAVGASIAATVKGFAEFDPSLRLAGVLCNHLAGPRHFAQVKPAIRTHTHVEPLGWLPRRSEWHIPERHLGLVLRRELDEASAAQWDTLAQAVERCLNLDRLLELCQSSQDDAHPMRNKPLTLPRPSHPSRGRGVGGEGVPRRVAVAQDAAFCFYYQDNLDLLEACGATIVPFSPIDDAQLAADVDLVYLGGGYPELHAQRLAGNRTMLESLRRYHAQGGAIYAECGGLMYCCRELVDLQGRNYPLLDLLPARTVMQERLAALGYVAWSATNCSLLGAADTELRGHEYHYSRLEPLGPLQSAAQLIRADEPPRPDGFVSGNLLAGYAHLHFGSNSSAAGALLRLGR